MSERSTHPVDVDELDRSEQALVLHGEVTGPDGAHYIHKDYVKVTEAWAVEQHIGPVNVQERFGDIESWAEYVKRYSGDMEEGADLETYITWNAGGLKAVLDYHTTRAGRCGWRAEYPFQYTQEWRRWQALTTGPIPQRKVVEALEEGFNDVVEPNAATLLDILRNLRGNVSAKASVSMRENGTSDVHFQRETNARGGAAGDVELPNQITIAVPIIRGHLNDQGERVIYRFDVKLRAIVGDNGELGLTFTILGGEVAMEQVFGDILTLAKGHLGDSFTVYRAAD